MGSAPKRRGWKQYERQDFLWPSSISRSRLVNKGVERVVYYTQEVEQDADYERPENKPSPEWPAQGAIEFKNVEMNYRPELPTVLKGLTMNVQGGGRRLQVCL